MSPTPYRSSYMSDKNRKLSAYGDSLSHGRKLGKHLPRIASGDGDDDWVEERKEDIDRRRRRETREKERRARVWDEDEVAPTPLPKSPHKQDIVVPGVSDSEDVTGIPGRLRLSRDKTPSTPASPLPSARLARGLWADTQRHHLQAYEYLCHVGEAQQWIEGCLGEELEFGVVEMEEGLRNGVVLAKLVRAFKGEKVVRRIYEVCTINSLPICDITILNFIRHQNSIFVIRTISMFSSISLEKLACPKYVLSDLIDSIWLIPGSKGFIFELTDLYNKKNLPKVIYCIHALRLV